MFIVDAYSLFNVSHVFTDEIKIKCFNRSGATMPRGNILWKMIYFNRNPTPNILLGDSRVFYITNSVLEHEMGGVATNLSIPGGNYRTIIDLFWTAAESIKLENVMIQSNFNSYNTGGDISLFRQAQQAVNKPYKFFFNWNYLKDSFSVLYYSVTRDKQFANKDYKRIDNNWKLTEKTLEKYFATDIYSYSTSIHEDLTKIATYCDEENINLTFVIAPNYHEVYSFLEKNGKSDDYHWFKTDIKSLGKTIDLDIRLPFSYIKKYYFDHFHIRREYTDSLTSMIFHPIH